MRYGDHLLATATPRAPLLFRYLHPLWAHMEVLGCRAVAALTAYLGWTPFQPQLAGVGAGWSADMLPARALMHHMDGDDNVVPLFGPRSGAPSRPVDTPLPVEPDPLEWFRATAELHAQVTGHPKDMVNWRRFQQTFDAQASRELAADNFIGLLAVIRLMIFVHLQTAKKWLGRAEKEAFARDDLWLVTQIAHLWAHETMDRSRACLLLDGASQMAAVLWERQADDPAVLAPLWEYVRARRMVQLPGWVEQYNAVLAAYKKAYRQNMHPEIHGMQLSGAEPASDN